MNQQEYSHFFSASELAGALEEKWVELRLCRLV